MNDIFHHTLPNGMRLVHRRTSSPVCYAGIMTGAGTRDEQPEENGMAHYIEHCVFKGCRTASLRGGAEKVLTAAQIIDRVEGVGGEINAYTTKEETVFYAAAPTPYFGRTVQLLADLVFRPVFPKEETDKETGVILDEIESYNDSPSELIYDDFESLLFAGHPLALPILGTRRTLRHISRSPLAPLQWMQQHYLADRTVVFSQGNLSFQHVIDTMTRALENAPLPYTAHPHPAAPPRSTPACQETGQQATFRKHTHQTHVMLGARAYNIGHPKQPAATLLNHILGGSMSSRLNMRLREKEGLVYTVESQYTPLSDSGYWSVYLACEPRHKEQCVELCTEEFRRLREQRLSQAQFHRALVQLRGQTAIAAENQENNVLSMGKQTLYNGHATPWQETYARIARLTPQELQETAEELLRPERLCLLAYE
jgi:predicted Zn-dependent peptidase